jgi:hypothetical protein
MTGAQAAAGDSAQGVIRPIAILRPTVRNVASGKCTRLRRVANGALGKLEPGDRLWLREAFYLNALFDDVSPHQAADAHAWPRFERDLPPGPNPMGLGKHRGARLLLRAWHRAHLVVVAVERQRLQDITDAEIVADGFASRAAWAQAWDRGVDWFSKGRAWAGNPEVVVFDFRFVAEPLPALPPKPKRKSYHHGARAVATALNRRAQVREQLNRPRPEPVEPIEPIAPPAGLRWCGQCDQRVSADTAGACRSPFCQARAQVAEGGSAAKVPA